MSITDFPFRNPELPLELRVADLVSRLTLDEKIDLMCQYQEAVPRLGIAKYKHGTEAAHGIAWLGEATVFPQPFGLACTWDEELLREVGRVIGTEARGFFAHDPASHGLTLWAPTVDLLRDPRWGRTDEGYGEDPIHAGKMAAALVRGIQGDHPFYLRAVASPKHFIGNNNEVGRGERSVSLDPRNMRESYLKAFELAFREGGAQSMMTSYNSVNGVPANLNPDINAVVKREWGMDGFVVSDAGDVLGTVNDHRYMGEYKQAVAASIRAGIDSITDDHGIVKQAIRDGLTEGLLEEGDLDVALRNTFRVRMRLGEFDPPGHNPYASIGEEAILAPQHRAVSLEAARKNIVLLKNDGALPLAVGWDESRDSEGSWGSDESRGSEGSWGSDGTRGSDESRDSEGSWGSDELRDSEGSWSSGAVNGAEAMNGAEAEMSGSETLSESRASSESLASCGSMALCGSNKSGFHVAVIGPLADIVYRDWYSGTLPYAVTPLAAIRSRLEAFGGSVPYAEGIDCVRLSVGGSYVRIGEGGWLTADGSAAEAEVFAVTDWGWRAHTFVARSTGLYATTDDVHLTADSREIFGWFTKEAFLVDREEDVRRWRLRTWNDACVGVTADGLLTVDGTGSVLQSTLGSPEEHDVPEKSTSVHASGLRTVSFDVDIAIDGLKEACEAAQGAAAAVVFVGNHPLVNGKETIDRPGLELPEAQRRLIRETAAANPNIIVVIVGSYPFSLGEERELAKAVLYTSHAGPELGNAIADVLLGNVSPAGRLNMTWHRSVEQLPDIMEYDLIRGCRTYRYFEGEPEFPFGYGLTYANIRYEELRLESGEIGSVGFAGSIGLASSVSVEVILRNESEIDSDEVVQLYGTARSSRVKRPLRQLLAFKRVSVPAGNAIAVPLRIAAEDLAFWDVTRERWCVETADWTLAVGPSSADQRLEATLTVVGETVPPRKLTERTLAMNYDDYSSAYLDECTEGGTAVAAKSSGAWLMFADADFPVGATRFEARIAGNAEDRIEIRLSGADGIVEFAAVDSLFEGPSGIAELGPFKNSSDSPHEAAGFEFFENLSNSPHEAARFETFENLSDNPHEAAGFEIFKNLSDNPHEAVGFETFENSSDGSYEAAIIQTIEASANTTNVQIWRTVSCSVAVPPGRYDVTLSIGDGMAISWFRFI